MDIDFITSFPTIYTWMLVKKVNGTLFVLMMHLCLSCGKYMPNDLGLDFWLEGNERYLDLTHKKIQKGF
jgi:hypothetical protein